MSDLRYEAPETLEAAIAMLGDDGAHIIAGGTDLIIQMDTEIIEPGLIVDIKKISETRAIVETDGGYRVGAAVTGMELMEHDGFCKTWPGVIDGVKLIGSIQIKGRATVGGNICNASPAADSTPALIAAGAVATIADPAGPAPYRSRISQPDPARRRWPRTKSWSRSFSGRALPIRARRISASRPAPRWISRWSASASI